MIQAKDLSFQYDNSEGKQLLDIDLHILPGELVAILGHNGCGKSTLAKHINALLPLQAGSLKVAQLDASCAASVWEIRRRAGMVFQNPDNQFVSQEVYEDICFGLRNYDVPPEEMPERVASALRMVDMQGFAERSTRLLSGGQKQRIALAAVLALDPDIIILDEASSMLDPEGREQVHRIIARLHKEQDKTIILITHFVEECLDCDRIFLMREGRVLAGGSPREILCDAQRMHEAGLEAPLPVRLYWDLQAMGLQLPYCPLYREEVLEVLCPY